jgi:CheY-like chemotaxis protein/anti-sigma regulatory factor (Ser/Thr protein kinase)
LAFSRKQPVRREIIDVNAILTELQPSVRRTLTAAIDLQVEVSPEPQWIYADPPQLIQALLNLINNAADAMPQGGMLLLAARTAADRTKPTVTIEVTDNGVGMDDQTAQRIFEPFFTTKTDSGGTGLGLATAYAIVQQNGGEIEVISRPKIGTTFKLVFPRHETKSPTVIPSSPPASSRRIRGSVLLVEDRDDLRELMSQVLSSSGLQVILARDGVEAIQAADKNKIDIILSDVVMPRLNGPEAVRIIRETHPDIKVVYVSGSADLIEPNGRDVVIWKPVKPQALLATIKSCLAIDNKSFNSLAS